MSRVAVILGATGLVGGHLAQQLTASNEFSKVVCPARRKLRFTHPKLLNPIIDFDNLENHRTLFEGDCLFSCLGTTLRQAGSIKAQRKVDYEYQLEVAKFARENGVQHYLLVSSTGASNRSRSPYLKMKGQLEQAVIELGFQQTTILQPSLLLGRAELHGETTSSRFGENLAAKIMPALCRIPGLQSYKPIKGESVALKLLQASLDTTAGVTLHRLDQVFPE